MQSLVTQFLVRGPRAFLPCISLFLPVHNPTNKGDHEEEGAEQVKPTYIDLVNHALVIFHPSFKTARKGGYVCE